VQVGAADTAVGDADVDILFAKRARSVGERLQLPFGLEGGEGLDLVGVVLGGMWNVGSMLVGWLLGLREFFLH
jgi:hypothetical protein